VRDENARKAELSKHEVTDDESPGRLMVEKIGPPAASLSCSLNLAFPLPQTPSGWSNIHGLSGL